MQRGVYWRAAPEVQDARSRSSIRLCFVRWTWQRFQIGANETTGAISISPGVPAASSFPCESDRVAKRRDIVRPLRHVYLAPRRDARATRAQQHAKANRCDRACWPGTTLNPVRNGRDQPPKALRTRRDSKPGEDRWDLRTRRVRSAFGG